MTRRRVAILVLLALIASGPLACATAQGAPKTTGGALLGSAAGGLLAAAAGGGTTGIIGGVLAGGLIGGAVGNALDQRDRELAMQQTQLALETSRSGQATSWQNPDSGNYGTVTPTRTYQTGTGAYCREFQQTIVVGGETHQAYGTACRQPDGSWQIQQ
jgi:surface antigen